MFTCIHLFMLTIFINNVKFMNRISCVYVCILFKYRWGFLFYVLKMKIIFVCLHNGKLSHLYVEEVDFYDLDVSVNWYLARVYKSKIKSVSNSLTAHWKAKIQIRSGVLLFNLVFFFLNFKRNILWTCKLT